MGILADLFEAVSDGVKLALCWFAKFMSDMLLLAVDGVLDLFPDTVFDNVDLVMVLGYVEGFTYLLGLDKLVAAYMVYVVWYLGYFSFRTIVKFVPTVG